MITTDSTSLWKETPLIYSNIISEHTGCNAYLKLENLHPSHSFKYRGISHFVQKAKREHGESVHLVIASGGNAGLAAACAANVLGVRCTVYIPEGAAESTLSLLRREKADVVVTGRIYAEALKAANELVNREVDAVMVPAYDNPVIWEGHSSMIGEISEQLSVKPDAILCSVGGGGLLGGLIVGCQNIGWEDVPIAALETIGSDCFYYSMSLNNGRFNCVNKTLPRGVNLVHDEANDVALAHFEGFSSKASGSLGASQPSARVVKMALERKGGIKCMTVQDELSMQAATCFADDHKFLVELACSTTLVPAYKPALFNKLFPTPTEDGKRRTVVFIVCGGFKISLNDMAAYQDAIEGDIKGDGWTVHCDDGETLRVRK